MAVERIEWQCPGCQRKFAIPSHQPRPKLCPHCQQTATAIPARRPANPQPAQAFVSAEAIEPELDLPQEPFDTLDASGGSSIPASRPFKRRRYEELRTLSLMLKVMAGVVALFTIVMLVECAGLAMDAKASEFRRLLVYNCFGVLIGGVVTTLVLYSFSVLLILSLDVEHNTRPD